MASAAVGKARLALEQYNAEILRLKKASQIGFDVSKQLGAAMIGQAQAARAVRDAMAQATTGGGAFANAMRGATEALQAQAGPLAGLSRAFAAFATPAGLAAGAVTAAAGAMIVGSRAIADYQEQLDLASDATGLTTGQLAGLRVAASENGRTFEQIRPALDFFTRKIGDAAGGSEEATRAFTKLGIGVKDAAGQIRPTGDILRDAQAKLGGMGTAAERSAAAMAIFGRSGAASINALLTPLDEAEAKARKLGLALGPEAEKVARQADAAFDSLGTSVQGMGNSFGVAAAQITGPFLESLAKASTAAAAFVRDPNVADLKEIMLRWSGHAELVPQIDRRNLGADPSKWNVPEGNRPWDTTTGVVATPKWKSTWTEADGGTYSESPFYSMPGLKSTHRPDTERMGVDDFLKDVKFQLEGLEESAKPFVESIKQMEKEFQATQKAAFEFKKQMAATVANGFGSFVADAIRGVDDLGAAFENMITEIVAQLAAQAAAKGIMSLLLPGSGAAAGAQSGGTFLQSGGTIAASWMHPIMAQSGLVVSGVRGMDTVPARLGKGETVISHQQTDYMNAVMKRMDAFISKAGSQNPEPSVTIREGAFTFNIEAGLNDPIKLQETVSDKIIPAIHKALRYGSYRRSV